MKLVLVLESFGAGVLNAVVIIANEFAREHDVTVIHDIRPDTPEGYANLFLPSVKLVRFSIRRSLLLGNLLNFFKFRSLIRGIDPDVVHLHSSFAGAFGRLSLLFEGDYRVFYSPHAFKFIGGNCFSNFLYYSLEWVLARGGAKIIACSKGELVHARRLTVDAILLENSIDTEAFQGGRNNSLGSVNKVVVGTVGRMVDQKRPFIFAKIARVLGSKYPDVEFRWVGGGDDKYRDELTRAGVVCINQVPVSEIPAKLAEFDIYVQCSAYEGMPLSVIEAQVSGLPCVVSDCDGNRDIVVDEVTGYVVDDERICEKIEYLILNENVRLSIGLEARKKAKIRFDKRSYINSLSLIYGFEAARGM